VAIASAAHQAIPGLCVRAGITSAVFHRQVEQGVIAPTSTMSLPLHPLLLYFGLASLAILLVLVWQIRRGAAPGRPALIFCVLQSAVMLLLELLRAIPRPSVLMTAIPLAVLVASLAAVVAGSLRSGPATIAARRAH
jgi:prolipoprotein diacylglyceryltransferase